jgi:ABC-2 type transport system permease protein
MNWRAIWAIARKDVTVSLRSKTVLLPMILVPALMMIVMPLVMAGVAYFAIPAAAAGGDNRELQELMEIVPVEMVAQMESMSATGVFLTFMLSYFLGPLYLLIPIMASTVIAADSFAGEKERKTLEAIVYTPTTDGELLLSKIIGGWLPGILVGWISFLIYCVVANAVAWPAVGALVMPTPTWLLLAFWVGPAASALGLGVTVLVSSRVNTFQEANQMGGLVVLPIILLVIGQASGVLFLSPLVAVMVGIGLWLVDGVIFYIGARTFRRSEIIARL